MNGRGLDCILVPLLIMFMFLLNVKYPFMPPFTNGMAKDHLGKVVVITHEQATMKEEKEKLRVEQLAKEAEEIKSSYAKAYRDCNGKSWEKYGSTSAISVEYAFNSYDKTCYKTTMTGDLTKGTEGLYRDNFKITYETEFVRSELRDYMLVYRE
ncbi:hypothetical protein [Pseudomonas graminis]|uniref:hypothetical protein n=1 Tax=Pseudomonas graminis TaxID=158627 RepID=UPI003C1AA5E4